MSVLLAIIFRILFGVQHYVCDVFLALVEVALMSHPGYNSIVTGLTLLVYAVFVLYIRPFGAQLDLVLNLFECALSIVALWLSWMTETTDEVPQWVKSGLWIILALQIIYVPFRAWPIIQLIVVSLRSPVEKIALVCTSARPRMQAHACV